MDEYDDQNNPDITSTCINPFMYAVFYKGNQYTFNFVKEPLVTFSTNYNNYGVKFSYIVAESYTTISINDDSPFVAWRFYCDYRCGETILIYTKELVEKIKSIPEFTIVDFERVIVDELESIIMSTDDENECMHYNNSTHYAPGGLAFDAPFPAEATADNTEDNDIYPYDMACHFIFHNHTEMLDFANRHQLSLSQI